MQCNRKQPRVNHVSRARAKQKLRCKQRAGNAARRRHTSMVVDAVPTGLRASPWSVVGTALLLVDTALLLLAVPTFVPRQACDGAVHVLLDHRGLFQSRRQLQQPRVFVGFCIRTGPRRVWSSPGCPGSVCAFSRVFDFCAPLQLRPDGHAGRGRPIGRYC